MKTWKTIQRRTILDHSKFLRVEEHVVGLPDGRVIDDWPWVVTPDFVNVVVVQENGRFLFFRQTKYAIAGISLAPVGGYLEPDEDPLATAKRELLEEMGMAAPDWTPLGTFPVDGNRGAGIAHFYLAQNAHPVAHTAHSDDLEEQTLVTLTRAEVESALRNGEFKLMPWAAIVALALHHLDHTSQK